MKLTGIRTDILRITEDDPLADMPEERARLPAVLLERLLSGRRSG
jgi:hypothetical protein